MTARNAVAAVFALNGLAIGSWFSRVPAVRDALELSPGRLGVLLLAMSAGAVLALPIAGAVVHRVGPANAAMTGMALAAVGLALTGTGAAVWTAAAMVAAGLFAAGAGVGVCEVAMNVEGAAVERRLRRTIMPRFHAAWSVGSVAGALLGAGAARIDLPVSAHLGLVAAVVAGGTLAAVSSFLPAADGAARDAGAAGHGGARDALRAWREPRTLLVGLLVLVMAFAEGTANDWMALAFVDGYGLTEAAGASVFGVFVTAMTVGRTVGVNALDRWGRVRVLFATMLLAAGGAALTVLGGAVALAVLGAGLWGLGTSLGFPVGMSAAADEQEHAAARVSVVAVIGYTAFLAGPPVVGLLGDRVGVLRALLVVPLLVLPAVTLVPALRPPPGAARGS